MQLSSCIEAKVRLVTVCCVIVFAHSLSSLPASATSLLPGDGAQHFLLPPPRGGSRVSGKIESVGATTMVLALRSGARLLVDFTKAQENHAAVPLFEGEFVQVEGTTSGGAILAQTVTRIKGNKLNWEQDLN